MEQEKNIKIHETAFVTSTFRAFDENLSQDNFAKLWQNSKTERWIVLNSLFLSVRILFLDFG